MVIGGIDAILRTRRQRPHLQEIVVSLAYLVNRYPAVSHSFIRREIAALEKLGVHVERYSIRSADGHLPDAQDRSERELTHYILGQSPWSLATAVFATFVKNPFKSAATLLLALQTGSRSATIFRGAAYFVEACWLRRDLGERRVTHMHAHFGTNPAAVARFVRALGGPAYSFTVHGPDEFDQPIALDLAGKIQSAAKVVAISSFGRSQLMRWSAIADWHKLIIVRCGVDASFLDAPKPFNATSTDFCCVARLNQQKGIPVLVAACELLRDTGAKFHVTIVGDGELRAVIERSVRDAHLEDYVSLVGACDGDKVRQHMLDSRAFVLPSFAEGLPVVLMEALALCRPVIATSIAGVGELVTPECGWVVPSGSAPALAEAMKSALDASPDQLRQMGSVGRQRVEDMHNCDRNAQIFLEEVLPQTRLNTAG